jgi:hypothetical protein
MVLCSPSRGGSGLEDRAGLAKRGDVRLAEPEVAEDRLGVLADQRRLCPARSGRAGEPRCGLGLDEAVDLGEDSAGGQVRLRQQLVGGQDCVMLRAAR